MPQLHNGKLSVNVYDINKKQSHSSGKSKHDNIKINRQYYNYCENICAQRMMVIVWDRKNKKSFRRQRKICILDPINLIGTTRLANILNRNTQFLYKKQFLSKLNKSCNIFS